MPTVYCKNHAPKYVTLEDHLSQGDVFVKCIIHYTRYYLLPRNDLTILRTRLHVNHRSESTLIRHAFTLKTRFRKLAILPHYQFPLFLRTRLRQFSVSRTKERAEVFKQQLCEK